MAFYAPLSFGASNLPEWNWHAPPFLTHWAEDLHHLHKPFHPAQKRHPTQPAFDIRETDKTYFLEGDFPGSHTDDDVKMHWTGRRTLVVEANVARVDLEEEWGIVLPKPEEEQKKPTTDPKTAAEAKPTANGEGPVTTEKDDDDNDNNDNNDNNEDLTLHRCLSHEEGESEKHDDHDNKSGPETTHRANSASSQGSQDSQLSEKKSKSLHRPSLSPSLKKRLSFGVSSHKHQKPQQQQQQQQQQHLGSPAAPSPTSPSQQEHHSTPPALRSWTSERHIGPCKRTFSFPEDVDHESLKARLNHGVLRVKIDKVEPMRPKPVDIDFAGAGYFVGI